MTLEVPKQLQRSRTKDEQRAHESARALLDVLAGEVGRADLAGIDVLDVGCGVRFSQALLNDELPIGSYTGVDVYPPVIEHLSANVSDPRFSYHHVDFFNARYNPTGQPMVPRRSSPSGIGPSI